MTVSAPPGALGVVVWVLLGIAAVVVVGSCAGALLLPDLLDRLHLITPLTSVAGPAVGLACALVEGWTPSTAGVLLVVALLAGTAPVLQSAIARTARTARTAPEGAGTDPGDG